MSFLLFFPLLLDALTVAVPMISSARDTPKPWGASHSSRYDRETSLSNARILQRIRRSFEIDLGRHFHPYDTHQPSTGRHEEFSSLSRAPGDSPDVHLFDLGEDSPGDGNEISRYDGR